MTDQEEDQLDKIIGEQSDIAVKSFVDNLKEFIAARREDITAVAEDIEESAYYVRHFQGQSYTLTLLENWLKDQGF